MKKTTLQDIATELGISKGTVYRAIHDKMDVSPSTRTKVLELVEKWNYKPDRIARSLSMKPRTVRIGTIYQTIPDFFWSRVKKGIMDAKAEYEDFGLEITYKELLEKDRYTDEIVSRMDELITEDVDGIILVPVNSAPVRKKIAECSSKGIAVAALNDDITDTERIFYVGPQMRQSGRVAGELTGKFLKNGGKVLTISTDLESLDYQERFNGFIEILKERFNNISIVANYKFNYDMLDAKDTIKKILENTGGIEAIYDIDGASLYDIGCIVRDSEKLKGVILIGHEISEGVRELLEDNTVHACISQDPYSQGFFTAKYMYEYLAEGKKPFHDRMYTRVDVIMRENMKNEENIINQY